MLNLCNNQIKSIVTNKTKEALHQMIADGKTGGVVQQLLEITQYFGDENLEQEANLLASEYDLYRQRASTVSEEQHAKDVEKINQQLIDLINKIPAQGQAPHASHVTVDGEESQKQFSWWKMILILVIIAGILYWILT